MPCMNEKRPHDRAPDKTQITISMTKTLLAEIDVEAAADNRNRSNWIVTELAAAVRAKAQLRKMKSFGGAGEMKGADAGGFSISSARRPGALPESPTTFNEEPPGGGTKYPSKRDLAKRKKAKP